VENLIVVPMTGIMVNNPIVSTTPIQASKVSPITQYYPYREFKRVSPTTIMINFAKC
jgi:pyruvate/2-oxoacid:ferredoxin oxidoreductase beta subunit